MIKYKIECRNSDILSSRACNDTNIFYLQYACMYIDIYRIWLAVSLFRLYREYNQTGEYKRTFEESSYFLAALRQSRFTSASPTHQRIFVVFPNCRNPLSHLVNIRSSTFHPRQLLLLPSSRVSFPTAVTLHWQVMSVMQKP